MNNKWIDIRISIESSIWTSISNSIWNSFTTATIDSSMIILTVNSVWLDVRDPVYRIRLHE